MRGIAFFLLIFSALAVNAQALDQWIFERPANSGAANLRVYTPNSSVIEQAYSAGEDVIFSLRQRNGAVLNDGIYRWELVYSPQLSAQQMLALANRVPGQDPGTLGLPAAISPQSGQWLVTSGQFAALGDQVDEPPGDSNPNPDGGAVLRPGIIIGNHEISGNLCVGTDCVNGESYGFDTIRLKENNIRIHFLDTSSTGSFPTNDWELTANSSVNGGANYFAITDRTAGRQLFLVEAAAPSNSLYVDSSGDVGLGTPNPAVDLHVVEGDTPTLRLEQDNSNAFTPQTWDVAGNETNFFVRDATNGSRLPFKIIPNTDTNALVLTGSSAGFGILLPTAAVHVRKNSGFAQSWLLLDVPSDGDPLTEERLMELDASGNLFVGGSITQLSSRHSKQNLVRVAGGNLLDQLAEMPIWTWNYLTSSADDRHIGPVAEDFYATFGFGRSTRSLAPGDVAGVALAATQALQTAVAERDQKIRQLEQRLERLEALFNSPGAAISKQP